MPCLAHRATGRGNATAGALASCDRDDLPGGNTDASGTLRFEVRMNNNWHSGMSIGNTKAAIDETAFPGSAAGITYQIGLSILRATDGTAYITGSDHILAELTVKTGSPDAWRYQLKGTTTWLTELPHPVKNEGLTVAAYYPYNASTAVTTTNTDVPFDLTATTEQADQTDLLYAPTANVTPGSVTPLAFRHFYALLEFRMKKKQADAATLTGVNVLNASGKTWLASKGNYNACTGLISGTPTAGTVSCTGLNLALTTTGYQTVQVMVPSRTDMAAYADGDILVQFDFDSLRTDPLPLKREWLFAGTSTGLTAGMKYSFQLLYDAVSNPSASLTLIQWDYEGADTDVGESLYTYWNLEYGKKPLFKTMDVFNGVFYLIPSPTTQNYLNEGSGQSYQSIEDIFLAEPPYVRFSVSDIDATNGFIDWQGAIDACKELDLDGGGRWRLPRATELMLMWMNHDRVLLQGLSYFAGERYWSATESDSGIGYNDCAWFVDFGNSDDTEVDIVDKLSETCMVRCIRDN